MGGAVSKLAKKKEKCLEQHYTAQNVYAQQATNVHATLDSLENAKSALNIYSKKDMLDHGREACFCATILPIALSLSKIQQAAQRTRRCLFYKKNHSTMKQPSLVCPKSAERHTATQNRPHATREIVCSSSPQPSPPATVHLLL